MKTARVLPAFLVLVCFFKNGDASISAWTEPAISGTDGTGTLSVPEDQAIDTTIVTYAATSDVSVTYSLVSAVTPFSLTTGGALTITAALDFETAPSSYTLEVKATDADGTGVATITVTVTDAYPPTFSSPPTTACIMDNSVADTTLTTVLATDTETSQTVTHTIAAAGNTNTDFKIGGTTGVIQVNTGKTLDKATTPTYTLEIEADDGALTSTATLVVTVADTCSGSATVALSFVALVVALIASLN